MEKSTSIIILGITCFVLLCISGFLGFKTWQLDQTQSEIRVKFQEIQQNPHFAVKREFEAKDLYESAAQLYLNTFNQIDSTLKMETQRNDKLSHESFIKLFEQSFAGFNMAIKMAEKVLTDYPETYYHNKVATEGILISGNYYAIPVLRENRDAVLQKFMANRGEAIAHLTKEECKLIDKAISQYAVDKQPAGGTEIQWENLTPYFHPESRLASCQGNDIFGNPFALGRIDAKANSVKVSPATYEKFRAQKFDWGPYSPAEP